MHGRAAPRDTFVLRPGSPWPAYQNRGMASVGEGELQNEGSVGRDRGRGCAEIVAGQFDVADGVLEILQVNDDRGDRLPLGRLTNGATSLL